MKTLQLVQNSAARLRMGFNRQHQARASLHWCSVWCIIDFKILHSYIADMLTPYEPTCTLRSSDGALLKSRLECEMTMLFPSGPCGLECPGCHINEVLLLLLIVIIVFLFPYEQVAMEPIYNLHFTLMCLRMKAFRFLYSTNYFLCVCVQMKMDVHNWLQYFFSFFASRTKETVIVNFVC